MSGDAAEQFNIHDAKTNLSRIIERVEHGEEIVISRAGRPVQRLSPWQAGSGEQAAGRCAASSSWRLAGTLMRSTSPIAADFGMTS